MRFQGGSKIKRMLNNQLLRSRKLHVPKGHRPKTSNVSEPLQVVQKRRET